jgi:hypothetical protein
VVTYSLAGFQPNVEENAPGLPEYLQGVVAPMGEGAGWLTNLRLLKRRLAFTAVGKSTPFFLIVTKCAIFAQMMHFYP